MASLISSSSLQTDLTATVYFMVALTTCSTSECRLQLTEKNKHRSVILNNIDNRVCHYDCMEDAFILAWCFPLRESRETAMPGGTNPENHHYVLKTSCGKKICTSPSVCLEKGCSKVCVQAPDLCDLHSAAKTGDLAKVKAILSLGHADMNCKEWHSRTPVLLAARGGHRDVVQQLISTGANVSVVDDFGINILHSACQGGYAELVEYVFALDKHDINGATLCGGTPAMLAAENGHREVVELLVGRGANVSLQSNDGNTILHYACRGGHMEVVKYILPQNMVDINSRGRKSKTPMMVAAENGHRNVMELLVSKGASMSLKSSKKGNTILHFACIGGDLDCVKYVLSRNIVDINSRNWKGITPVLIAARKGHKDVVELLVRKRANISLQDMKHNNILHHACRWGHVEVVKYVLSQNSVNINSKNSKKRTPKMEAEARGYKDVVELFGSKGAVRSLV